MVLSPATIPAGNLYYELELMVMMLNFRKGYGCISQNMRLRERERERQRDGQADSS